MAPPSQPLPADDVFHDRSFITITGGIPETGVQRWKGRLARPSGVRKFSGHFGPVSRTNFRGVRLKCGASEVRAAGNWRRKIMGRVGTILKGYVPSSVSFSYGRFVAFSLVPPQIFLVFIVRL